MRLRRPNEVPIEKLTPTHRSAYDNEMFVKAIAKRLDRGHPHRKLGHGDGD